MERAVEKERMKIRSTTRVVWKFTEMEHELHQDGDWLKYTEAYYLFHGFVRDE